MGHATLPPEKQLQVETRRLMDEFGGVFDAETVEGELRRTLDDQHDARIRTYVPVFAYRFAREALRARAVAEGRTLRRGA